MTEMQRLMAVTQIVLGLFGDMNKRFMAEAPFRIYYPCPQAQYLVDSYLAERYAELYLRN